MRPSLTARVALGLVVQLAVFGVAVVYLIWATDSLFEQLSVLKDDLEPATDDLRNLVFELRGYEDLADGRSDRDLVRLRDFLPRARIYERIGRDASRLRKVAATEGGETEIGRALQDAVRELEDILEGDRLVSGALKSGALAPGATPPRDDRELLAALLARLDLALGRGENTHKVAGQILRCLRSVRARVMRASSRTLAASRGANDRLFRRRSEISYAMLVVPAAALLIALAVIAVTLAALRPVRDLATAVRRLSKGDFDARVPGNMAGELGELAQALDILGDALRNREADLERKKDELMRAERLALVGRMASVVAHEVRNPLNSIALHVELLKDRVGMLDQEDARGIREVLDAVQREVDRLSDITEEYLKFGRLPKGTLAPCDVARVVRETSTFMEGEFGSAGVRVEVDVPGGAVQVLADEAQLRQALVNLLRNAAEAMPEGGTISVSLRVHDGDVALEVSDEGMGIPEDFKPRLFEPFATTKPRGTGLGLAFVQQVAHESGGSVEVESGQGKGTRVRLTLKKAV